VLNMSAIARARGAARWLPVLLSLGFITAAASVDADANPESKNLTRADEPFVIALASSTAPAVGQAPPPIDAVPFNSTLPAPAPARFFTISEVLAKANGRPQPHSSIHLASVDTGDTAMDTNAYATARQNKGDEPFGLFTFVAPDGLLWTKWRKVVDDIRVVDPIVMRCLADAKQCPSAAAQFSAIVNDAREQKGRAKLELVNQRVNAGIRYKNDVAQWNVPDLWSAPLDASNTGSFNTGYGDCEDYAIAKYVALRAAGVPARQLRVLLVHDQIARMDHAVLAALDEGRWFILDNRWTHLVEDSQAKQFVPLFALDEQGVKLLAVPYAAKHVPQSEPAKTGEQIFVPGGEAERPSASSSIGSAPVLL
jgi:predicted transglutaminase-like cysteine proteinase